MLIVAIIQTTQTVSAQKITIMGDVVDQQDSAPLAGVVVYTTADPQHGTTTDTDGTFRLETTAGEQELNCSYLGYEKLQKKVTVSSATRKIHLTMTQDAQEIREVMVRANSTDERLKSTQIGVDKISMEELERLPAFLGERDVMKSLQLMPGVKAEGDGSSGFMVRGGTASQNNILLDDATIYNAGHVMGLFSNFNDYVLGQATLYKGQIPSSFGGGVSSVFDVGTRMGDAQRFHGNASLGILAAKVGVEGPIVRDRLSFMASARRTYFDVFLKLTEKFKSTTLNFYDLNFKLNYKIGERDRLSVSAYLGKDNMGLEETMDMDWGNRTVSTKWTHQFCDNLHLNVSAHASEYSTDNAVNVLDSDMAYEGYIRQYGGKVTLSWMCNELVDNHFGYETMYRDLETAKWNFNDYAQEEVRYSWENALWWSTDWSVTQRLKVNVGLRMNMFFALGGTPYYEIDGDGNVASTINKGRSDVIKRYLTPEPRVSANFSVSPRMSVKAGYCLTTQHVHTLSNGTMSLPFNRSITSSNILKPLVANQGSAGVIWTNETKMWEVSGEAYYKKIKNVLDYRDGKTYSSEIELERLVLAGEGRAYGVEAMVRKNMGVWTGWVSYTLSWSGNKIEGINSGRWYTANNDRRHDISVAVMYGLSERWALSATWKYNTGQALTAPSAKYLMDNDVYYYYEGRNKYRAPAYHRLDLGATYTKRGKRVEREWAFGVYNVYSRKNPYIITFENDEDKASGIKASKVSLYGLVPSVSYSIKF